jgi:hypothetical protein
MTILDSLGGQSAVVKAGEDPQLKLAPDAEALALFAGLFAMLHPQEENTDAEDASGPVVAKSALVPDDEALSAEIHKTGFDTLPAAARLMMDGAPGVDMPAEHSEMTGTASLAKLLIAAKSLSEDADLSHTPSVPTASDVEIEAPRDMTTAKAILARAIEILDDIDNSPGQMAEARAEPALVETTLVETTLAETPLAETTLVETPPINPADAGKPVVNDVISASYDPAAKIDGPGAEPVTRVMTVPAPSDKFVGPMPAIPVIEDAVRKVAQPAPSDKFVGPMPAIPVTEAPVRLVVQPAPSTQFVGPMPLQPVPLAGYGEAGHLQPGHLQPGQGQPGMWQSDIDGAAATSDGLPAMKGEKSGGGGALDQVKIRQQVGGDDGFRRSLGTENGKMDSASVSGMTQRDVRLYAEQTSAAGSQPSSGSTSSGSSSSSQSSAGQSASAQSVAAAGGQGGGQTGGQNQSGQGGGQSAAQGFADASPSRDVADRTMLHRLNTANAGWSETMIKRLTSDLRSGVQTVRIILEPRHLGRLNVDLGLRNGKASIRIAAETAEAAKLLGSARGQLGQMLEQSGMRLASFQTSSGGQDAAMDGNGGQQGHAQSGADGKNTGRDQGFSNKVIASDSEMRQADDSYEGQDLALREGETAVLSVLA